MIEKRSQTPGAQRIVRGARDYPAILLSRLANNAPAELAVLGNPELLRTHRTALFCSARTPGEAILRAHDAARRMRDDGITVISGFHSPIEKECLRILLRGKQPIIICPARALGEMHIPTECRDAFSAGRMMFLSPFADRPKRVTEDSALRRNEVVAALADAAYIAYIAPGGQAEQVAAMLAKWRVPGIQASN